MDISSLGKWLIASGLVICSLGIVFWLAAKGNIPFGRLPGDFQMRSEHWSFYAPIATSLTFSLILTLIANIILWFMRR